MEDDTISPLYTLHCGVFLPNAEDRTLSTQKRKEQQVRDLYAMAGRYVDKQNVFEHLLNFKMWRFH